jgi:hypothetical protein
MKREIHIDSLEAVSIINDMDDAEAMLTEEERGVLGEYSRFLSELYPDGAPDEETLKAISAQFPGVDEVIKKLLNNGDTVRALRRRSKAEL